MMKGIHGINASRQFLVLINTGFLMDWIGAMMRVVRVFVRMKMWYYRMFKRKVRDHSRFRCLWLRCYRLPSDFRDCWESRNMWDKRHLLLTGLQ